MKIEQTPASTYFQIIESGCHKRLHSVHRPSCRAVDCDSSDIRFCNVRSPVQWLTADSITGKENAILVFKIDSRFEHCTCLHHCVAITKIVNRNFQLKSKEFEHMLQCGFQSMSFARSSRICSVSAIQFAWNAATSLSSCGFRSQISYAPYFCRYHE